MRGTIGLAAALLAVAFLSGGTGIVMGSSKKAAEAGGGRSGSLTASKTAGTAPATVTFTGNGGGASYFGGVWLHFGDGTNALFCRPGSGCQENTMTHTYEQAGVYKAELIGAGEGESYTLGTVSIDLSK